MRNHNKLQISRLYVMITSWSQDTARKEEYMHHAFVLKCHVLIIASNNIPVNKHLVSLNLYL